MVDEVKKMIYKQIEKKQKQVDPAKHNMRIVEENLAEVEILERGTSGYNGRRHTKKERN